MGNYVTVSEVRAYKVNGSVVDLTAYSDADIEERIGFVENTIERITNDIFYTKTETNKFDGKGLDTLFFAPTIPYRLISITSVKEYDIDQTTVLKTYTENTHFIKYPFYLTITNDSGRPRNYFYGGSWPKGDKNIWVAGTWGYATTPPLIKKAAYILTLESLIPGSSMTPSKDIPEIEWEDFRIRFSVDDIVGEQTGFVVVDRDLSNYINYSTLFNVIPDSKQSYDSNTIRLMPRS